MFAAILAGKKSRYESETRRSPSYETQVRRARGRARTRTDRGGPPSRERDGAPPGRDPPTFPAPSDRQRGRGRVVGLGGGAAVTGPRFGHRLVPLLVVDGEAAGGEVALQDEEHEAQDGQLGAVLEEEVGVPGAVREGRHGLVVPAEVGQEEDGEEGLQEGAREEEEVAGDGDPDDALHLALGGDLVDVAQGLEHGAEAVGED